MFRDAGHRGHVTRPSCQLRGHQPEQSSYSLGEPFEEHGKMLLTQVALARVTRSLTTRLCEFKDHVTQDWLRVARLGLMASIRQQKPRKTMAR